MPDGNSLPDYFFIQAGSQVTYLSMGGITDRYIGRNTYSLFLSDWLLERMDDWLVSGGTELDSRGIDGES